MKAYVSKCVWRVLLLDYRWAMSGNAIKLPPTWRDLYPSKQKLLWQGVEPVEVPGCLGNRSERWLEICGACSVRVVALGVEEVGVIIN